MTDGRFGLTEAFIGGRETAFVRSASHAVEARHDADGPLAARSNPA